MKVIVYHDFYGCGGEEYDCNPPCCGHSVKDGEGRRHFVFSHQLDDQTPELFAHELVTMKLGADRVKDIDWDNCVIKEDCN